MDKVELGIEQNYKERTKIQSNSSKYIQVKRAEVKGGYADKPIEDTYDDKIIKPSLKKDKCETYKFTPDSFASAKVPSTISKSKSNKEIKELLPTKEKAEYGKIFVTETRGGFVQIRDETPGNKRWQNTHPAGTYNQIVDNGDMHEKIVHDRFIIIDKNWNISVGEDQLEIIVGNNKIQIRKDRETNITGSDNTNIEKDSSTYIGGNNCLEVGKNQSEKIGKDMNSNIIGELTETIGKDYKRTVTGKQSVTAMTGINHTSMATINIIATGTINITSSSMVKISAPSISLN